MSPSNAQQYYSEQLQNLTNEKDKLNTTRRSIFIARSITFITTAVLISFAIALQSEFYAFMGLVSFSLFLYVVVLDGKYKKALQFCIRKLSLLEGEIQVLGYDFANRNTGEEFKAINPHLIADFELVGKGSVFQYINRSSTKWGTQLFVQQLCNPSLDKDVILQRQSAISELAQLHNLRIDFQTYGAMLNERGDEHSQLQTWLQDHTIPVKTIKLVAYVLPLITLAWLITCLIGYLPFSTFIIPLLINLGAVSLFNKHITFAHEQLNQTAKSFKLYEPLFGLVENEDFQSELLNSFKANIVGNGHSASRALASLHKILSRFDIRHNMLVAVLFNSLVLFDLFILIQLVRWKKQYTISVEKWFDSLFNVDALMGFGTYTFNNEERVITPSVADDYFSFSAEALCHPLIKSSESVANSATMTGSPSAMIITGANMAGKSTFLRTVAVNLLFAMNGAPVLAQSFKFSPCTILSSIRIQDSLADNQSYFYAELQRLQFIIQEVERGVPALVVLDEIMRGTNSKDKQKGTYGLLEKLISLNASVIIATHDLSIGSLAQSHPDVVQNKCFEVELQNDELVFDYTLKDGVSTKLNASFLMQKMGITGTTSAN